MPYDLIFQPNSGASGDMILAALIDLLGCEKEFAKTFENLGLPVKIKIKKIKKNLLTATRIDIDTSRASAISHFSDISKFINQTPFSKKVQSQARRIFEVIFRVEAGIHGEDFKDVHLHELSADDSLIDILGFCWLWEKLGFCDIYFTTLYTGKGNVSSSHGFLPVPPPAVLELIRGCEFRLGDIESELLTPTAAAILTTCGRQLPADFKIKSRQTGSGAGHKTFAQVPNMLRVLFSKQENELPSDWVWMLEFNIDDMTPELLARFSEKIMAQGALDIFIHQGLMKKGRPGFQIQMLVRDEDQEKMIAAVFAETSTIGLRISRENRLLLQRREEKIEVGRIPVRVKISYFQNHIKAIKPEMADVQKVARKLKVSEAEALKKIRGVIREEYEP